MTLAAYSDNQPASDPVECDCGRPKQIGAECCSRCLHLDGRKLVETRIIGTLRLHSWLTLAEMGAVAGCHPSALQRHAQALVESGRLIRQLREDDAKDCVGRGRYGGMVKMKTGASSSWEYALSMRRVK